MFDLADGFSETHRAGFREDDDGYRAFETLLDRKYRHWRGRSARSYVFSVYGAYDCPAYEDAVLLVVDPSGGVSACLDLGACPRARLAELRVRYADHDFLVHVLAEREGDRRKLIDDLSPRDA